MLRQEAADTNRQKLPLWVQWLKLLEVEIELVVGGKRRKFDLLTEMPGSDGSAGQVSMEQDCKHLNTAGHLTLQRLREKSKRKKQWA